ncbi:MAG: NUDIX domain-containing protein [Bacteroidales bacterium]|jgi:8-oxo-dGTP pyrophosphatase MutT (NUDIX family)|nr:NUDIX domain-containing protein [Bacteroidales bacterium]
MKFPIKIYTTDSVTILKSSEELEEFASHYNLMKAAGGLVFNEVGEVLMIYKKGHYDFPKGKIEEHEPADKAALREIREETGVQTITIGKELATTFHTYAFENEEIPVLKETTWYKFNAPSIQELLPQTEEHITKVEWIKKEKVPSLLSNSYLSLQDLWQKVIE